MEEAALVPLLRWVATRKPPPPLLLLLLPFPLLFGREAFNAAAAYYAGEGGREGNAQAT